MVKFNKFSHTPIFESDDISPETMGIDWQELVYAYQNKPVDEAIRDIMEKLMLKENVEFDQICLILKHYILTNSDKPEEKNDLPYLKHFLEFNDQVYVHKLIERFMSLGDNPNSQWMITEIIKLVSSVCNEEQAGYLLKSSSFSKFLLDSIFDATILGKLKSTSGGFSVTEAAILTNLFETISNLCEIKTSIKNFVTQKHVDWLAEALLGINRTHTDLTESIAHIFNLISDNENLNQILGDLFINKNFYVNSIEYLSLNVQTNQPNDISSNLNSKLYLMSSLANILITNKSQSEDNTKHLFDLLKNYGSLLQYSLDLNLNKNLNKEIETLMSSNSPDADNEIKTAIKSIEKSSESKIISLDILSSILNYFIKDEGSEDEDYESWDECSDNEMDDNNNVKSEMDVEMDKPEATDEPFKIESQHIIELKSIINNFKLMDLLVKTISKDDENFLQETDRIEHIYNSVKLIRNESLKTYLLLIETLYLNKKSENLDVNSNIDLNNLFSLLEILSKKSIEDLEISNKKNESIVRIVEIIYDLFVYFNDSKQNVFNHEHRVIIVNLIKDVLFKFRIEIIELCVRLARIISMIAIKERDTNLNQAGDLIQLCSTIILELTTASFELADQTKMETLRLNAELMDVIIDLFGEDNLADLEKSLNFIERIKYFSDKFYTQYKKMGKKQKIDKDHGLIIKTVKDNFKSFVNYKIKSTK